MRAGSRSTSRCGVKYAVSTPLSTTSTSDTSNRCRMRSASTGLTATDSVAAEYAHDSNFSNFCHCRRTYHRFTAFVSVSAYRSQMSDSTLCAITTHGVAASFAPRPSRSTWA